MTQQPKKRAAIYLAAVFVAGSVFGVAAQRFYEAKIAAADSRPRTAAEWRQRFTNELQQELNLDVDQVAELQGVLEEMGGRWCEVWESVGPQFDALREEGASRISGMLDSEQQEKYQVILEERKRRRAEKRRAHCP